MSSDLARSDWLVGVLRRRPNFTVFVTNFCIMTLELVAGRLIAPFVGVSLYTWTAVIGIVLFGMTIGNYYGGKLADRWATYNLVGIALLSASVLSLLSLVLLGIGAASVSILPINYIVRVLALSLVFFFPSLALGAVSPIIVKLTLNNLDRTGETIGKIYAAAALGSIVGTYATGFWLISAFGVSTIILIVAAVLLIMALAYLDFDGLLTRRQQALGGTLIGVLLIALTVSGVFNFCSKESNYYCIRIDFDEESGLKAMRLNHLIHSVTDMNDPGNLTYEYEKLFAVFYEYSHNAQQEVLFLGGGAYTLPRYLIDRYDKPRGVVVEIDPEVSDIAFNEFDMPRRSSIATVNVDSRIFLKEADQGLKWDLIFGDAFSDFSIPYHLTTIEFSQMIEDHLTDEGWYVANVIDSLDPGLFVSSYLNTLNQVFDYTYLFRPIGQDDLDTNRTTLIIAAGNKPLIDDRLNDARDKLGFDLKSTTLVSDRAVAELFERGGEPIILTDDYAPVDNLIAPVFAVSGG